MNEYELKNGIYRLKDQLYVPTGYVRLLMRDGKTGEVVSDELVKNMFVTAGKVSLAASFKDPLKGMITYCSLGTSGVAPALGDTHLGHEIFRKLISVRESALNVFTAQTFFATSEANGTLLEAALFGDDASITPDSGTMFTHTNISRIKTSANTLTLAWAVTVG